MSWKALSLLGLFLPIALHMLIIDMDIKVSTPSFWKTDRKRTTDASWINLSHLWSLLFWYLLNVFGCHLCPVHLFFPVCQILIFQYERLSGVVCNSRLPSTNTKNHFLPCSAQAPSSRNRILRFSQYFLCKCKCDLSLNWTCVEARNSSEEEGIYGAIERSKTLATHPGSWSLSSLLSAKQC